MLDRIIRGGTVIDGTGGPGHTADVGILDGRIAAVGRLDETAAEVLDADGCCVAPGFVDPHTHYDAQLFWDPTASPSNLHGVTTVIGGNCGFTLAPLGDQDADYIRRMMARVEGMPLSALEAGLPWDWRGFGEYLDRLEGAIGVNAGFLVGHCAVRRSVMGEAAVGGQPTPEQLSEMARLLGDSLRGGGLGFSTSLAFTHSDGDGEPVPSRWATHDEVLALCRVVRDYEGTSLEFIIDGCLGRFSDEEVELMTRMSLESQRTLNWNVLGIDGKRPDHYAHQLGASKRAAEKGGRVVALTMPVVVEMNLSFLTHCALHMLPDWDQIMKLSPSERIEKLRDPECRRFLDERAHAPEAGVLARLANWGNLVIGDVFSSGNEFARGRSVGDIAEETGQTTFDALCDIVIRDELRTVLWPGSPDDSEESWALRAEAWEDDHILIGGSDAGAHLDRMCGSSYPTGLLADCLRGRRLVSVERAVQLMTQKPAEMFGLRDRGVLREGAHADVVIFDPETVDRCPVRTAADLPGGNSRLVADALGVQRVLVNGQVVVAEGESTGALAGRLLRSGRDTKTASL
ncbi:D-aminoacylase [Myxococcota bacterium]|nr:D-aminoacylase [Myxococcota bacterium]